VTNKGIAVDRRAAPPVPDFELDVRDRAILCTLLYYHIFRFPLKADEILRFSRTAMADTAEVDRRLERLVERHMIGQQSPYYFVGDPADVDSRIGAEARALAITPQALRRSRLIARFPFVRAVAITGTLSKGVMKSHDDLDFMVFTEPGRLWLARFVLMVFKKVFLLNSHRTFCINYLLSTSSLAIPDHDLFTATEIAWMRPSSNGPVYDRFIDHNRWVESFFPNWEKAPTEGVAAPPRSFFRLTAERLLNACGGGALDAWCQRLITRRNRRKYAALKESTFAVALRAEKHASKHHPRAFRDRTLDAYAETLSAFGRRHGIDLGKAESPWD